jgi:hypothetical protein
MPGGFGNRGCQACLGDDGEVARLRTGGQPDAQVRGSFPGHARRVPPEGVISDQVSERRQVSRRRRRQRDHVAASPVPALLLVSMFLPQ